MNNERQTDSHRWSAVFRQGFGGSFWLFVAFAGVMGVICYVVLGPEVFQNALTSDRDLIANVLPRVAAAQIVAGFVWVLLPRDRMTEILQQNQGKRGLLIAAAAGAITPGGPASAFPLLLILAATGADRGILVSYITSWALLGVQRLIVWDMPFMGFEFSMFRFLISLPLPILAGLLARRLPFSVSFEEQPQQENR